MQNEENNLFPDGWKNQHPVLEQFELVYDNSGSLEGKTTGLYPEVYLSFTIPVPSELPEKDRVLIDAQSDANGWRCILTMQGHLRLTRRMDGKTILETGAAVGILDVPALRIELILSNPVWPVRFTDWANDDPLDYSMAEIRINGRVCNSINMREPDLAVVPLRLTAARECSGLRAYNTIRRDLVRLPDDPGGPVVDTGFPDASRVMTRYDAQNNLLHLFTGAEFIRTDSYWYFCRIAGEGGLVRIHPTELQGAPGMAPACFRSGDRKNWIRCELLEAADESGRNRPLVRVPAGTWYLSCSIPFMTLELQQLLDEVRDLPDFECREIGKSALGHPIPLIRAGHGKTQVFFTIGQHSPMEMLGAHILKRMLKHFAEDPQLRDEFSLFAVPVVNMDAVYGGSDGWNGAGWNTNRCWFKDIQPETRAVEDFLMKSGIKPQLLIDWHSGGHWRGHSVLYFDDATIRKYAGDAARSVIARQNHFRGLLEKECGFHRNEQYSFPFRGCCAHDWYQVHFPDAVSITIELAVTTCFDPEKGRYVKMDQDSLACCGDAMVRVLKQMEK
ncbi:MAG: hypothetical protein IKO93_11060 [Lentisphaeria bacterium]|nr:hypothetical protein [Lentisphaeria bacterium]